MSAAGVTRYGGIWDDHSRGTSAPLSTAHKQVTEFAQNLGAEDFIEVTPSAASVRSLIDDTFDGCHAVLCATHANAEGPRFANPAGKGEFFRTSHAPRRGTLFLDACAAFADVENSFRKWSTVLNSWEAVCGFEGLAHGHVRRGALLGRLLSRGFPPCLSWRLAVEATEPSGCWATLSRSTGRTVYLAGGSARRTRLGVGSFAKCADVQIDESALRGFLDDQQSTASPSFFLDVRANGTVAYDATQALEERRSPTVRPPTPVLWSAVRHLRACGLVIPEPMQVRWSALRRQSGASVQRTVGTEARFDYGTDAHGNDAFLRLTFCSRHRLIGIHHQPVGALVDEAPPKDHRLVDLMSSFATPKQETKHI